MSLFKSGCIHNTSYVHCVNLTADRPVAAAVSQLPWQASAVYSDRSEKRQSDGYHVWLTRNMNASISCDQAVDSVN